MALLGQVLDERAKLIGLSGSAHSDSRAEALVPTTGEASNRIESLREPFVRWCIDCSVPQAASARLKGPAVLETRVIGPMPGRRSAMDDTLGQRWQLFPFDRVPVHQRGLARRRLLLESSLSHARTS